MERATLTGVILGGETQPGRGWLGKVPGKETPLTSFPPCPPRAFQWPEGRQPGETCAQIRLLGKSRVKEGPGGVPGTCSAHCSFLLPGFSQVLLDLPSDSPGIAFPGQEQGPRGCYAVEPELPWCSQLKGLPVTAY